ncbi:MAG: zinc ribbon domain-containing protein, partial [Anaerolineae bacterium]|nr:zinc ribbon domain-containing protein [Anaerolineae bacterium]
MLIYGYFCEACYGRFSHLAGYFDDSTPLCPRCGSASVERLISASNVIRSVAHHETQLKAGGSRVDQRDPQAAAGFPQESGRLGDASGLYGSQAYRELISRCVEGATGADLGDLVDDLVAAADVTPVAELAGMAAFSKHVENRIGAEGPPEGHEHGGG